MPRMYWRARRRSDAPVLTVAPVLAVALIAASAVSLRANPSCQAGLDEIIQIAVKNRPRISLFDACPKVLHHLIGMQDIGSDLVTPTDIGF